MPRERHKPEDDYTPVACPTCGEEIFQRVKLVVLCPVGWRNLSKEGIRSRKVQIESASWDDSRWFCGCGPNPLKGTKAVDADPIKKKPSQRRKKQGLRPGLRWTKGLVPEPRDIQETREDPSCRKKKWRKKRGRPKKRKR